jgi:hypothetical protein
MEPKVPPKCKCAGCRDKKTNKLTKYVKEILIEVWKQRHLHPQWVIDTYVLISKENGDTALPALGLKFPEIKKK